MGTRLNTTSYDPTGTSVELCGSLCLPVVCDAAERGTPADVTLLLDSSEGNACDLVLGCL